MVRKNLTETGVRQLAGPKSGRDEYADNIVPGLFLRVTDKGAKSWSVLYRVSGEGGTNDSGQLLKGRLHRMTLGRHPIVNLKDARARTRVALDLADQGKDPAQHRASEITERREHARNTFAHVSNRFIETHAKRNTRKWRETQRTFELHVTPRWGERPLSAIKRKEAVALLDDIVAEGKPHAAGDVLKRTRKLFNWAIERDLVEANPFDRVKAPVRTVQRERQLDEEEIPVIWRAAEELDYPFGTSVRLLLLTGQRRSEIAGLKWSWLRLDGDVPQFQIPGPFNKSGRPHVVPLSSLALEIIRSVPRFENGDFVLSTTAGQRPISGFSKAKARLDAKARELGDKNEDIKAWRLHDLRRTCASGMAELGIVHEIRERVLGHALSGLDKIYNKYDYLEQKRAALEAWAGRLRKLLG